VVGRVRLVGIGAGVGPIIAAGSAVAGLARHEEVVYRVGVGPRCCCALAAGPVRGWPRRRACTANHAGERAAIRGGAW
jgi:hypothetical protein